jgi:hypothetical protein
MRYYNPTGSMKRSLLVALASAGALLVVSGAEAKAPLDGVEICGAGGACVHLSMQQAEGHWSLFGAVNEGTAAAAVFPFYAVRWHWTENDQRVGYYVPGAGKTRQLDPQYGALWFDLEDAATVRAWSTHVQPFPAPKFTRVTVGGHAVRNPASYAKLFGRGTEAFPIILPGWLQIRFSSATPTPWTDEATDVRISRRGSLLWENGTMVKIPLRLAQRIRAGKPLR